MCKRLQWWGNLINLKSWPQVEWGLKLEKPLLACAHIGKIFFFNLLITIEPEKLKFKCIGSFRM
jgi:hypothetical protein